MISVETLEESFYHESCSLRLTKTKWGKHGAVLVVAWETFYRATPPTLGRFFYIAKKSKSKTRR
ncbi:hypothetical protein GCM10009133_02140 [Cocleimonas flava]